MEEQKVTPEIIKALEHVKSIYPDVCMVVFNKDGRWQFMDEDFKAPTFAATPQEVDISILEDAADTVPYLPYVYQM